MRTALLTAAALVAFAANSVLCRLALGKGTIDAASFTALRLVSGAAMLALLLPVLLPRGERGGGSWPSALALFLYALPFSLAYLSLPTGMGALLLFGAVQATMILAGLLAGERPAPLAWAGLASALGGLSYLVAPSLVAPPAAGPAMGPGGVLVTLAGPLAGSLLMLTAGVAWGIYSLRGRRSRRPVADTAGNFLRAAPLALLASAATLPAAQWTPRGALLAVASGALTSGVGYVLWYAALRGLTATRAAVCQLAVPAIAAAGGVALLGEPVTLRLLVAAGLILGGIAAVLRARQPAAAVRGE